MSPKQSPNKPPERALGSDALKAVVGGIRSLKSTHKRKNTSGNQESRPLIFQGTDIDIVILIFLSLISSQIYLIQKGVFKYTLFLPMRLSTSRARSDWEASPMVESLSPLPSASGTASKEFTLDISRRLDFWPRTHSSPSSTSPL